MVIQLFLCLSMDAMSCGLPGELSKGAACYHIFLFVDNSCWHILESMLSNSDYYSLVLSDRGYSDAITS